MLNMRVITRWRLRSRGPATRTNTLSTSFCERSPGGRRHATCIVMQLICTHVTDGARRVWRTGVLGGVIARGRLHCRRAGGPSGGRAISGAELCRVGARAGGAPSQSASTEREPDVSEEGGHSSPQRRWNVESAAVPDAAWHDQCRPRMGSRRLHTATAAIPALPPCTRVHHHRPSLPHPLTTLLTYQPRQRFQLPIDGTPHPAIAASGPGLGWTGQRTASPREDR